MRLFWISFALLLYANLAHAVELLPMFDRDRENLASAPVDNIEGSRCSDARDYLVHASEELRDRAVCKREGFVRYSWILAAVSRKVDIDNKTLNRTYMCCINMYQACFGAGNGVIEMVSEKDENGKEWKTAVDCGGTKSCRDPKRYFCLQEAANEPNHQYHPNDARRLEQYKNVPLCCPKFEEEKCDYEKSDSTGVDPNGDDCEKYFGRCKADDHTLLCSKKKNDEKASSCCKPHKTELCPGGIYPFGLKGKNGLVDWAAGNSGDEKAWKEACLNLATKPEFANASIYIFDGKCCAKAKLKAVEYYGHDYNSFLTDKYELLSTTGCQNDADCGKVKFCGFVTSSYKNEPATGKACFEKIHCPHKTKTKIYPVTSIHNYQFCLAPSHCPNDTICVKGKPAAATAAKVNESFGMCCPKAAYETEACTAYVLGDMLNTNTGLIDASFNGYYYCNTPTQALTIIDTGGCKTGEDKTEVCCHYPPVKIHNSTCTAAIMGNRAITGKPIEDASFTGRYLACDKEKKRKADEPKIDCGDKLGFCFADPTKPHNISGVCCDIELCPDGLTALSDASICDENCMWSNSPEKGKYCVEDKNKIKKCCPPKFIPEPDWRSGRYESNAPKNTEATKTNISCTSSRDCGGFGAFCNEEEKYCYRLGTRHYGSNRFQEFCTKAEDCEHPNYKDYTWWCVAFGPATGKLVCVTPTPPDEKSIPLMVDLICLFGSFLTSIAIVSLIYVICHVGAKWKTAKMMKKAGMATAGGGKATGKGATTGH